MGNSGLRGAADRERISTRPSMFKVDWPKKIDSNRLLTEISDFFATPKTEVDLLWRDYRSFSKRQQYTKTLKERKTLNTEESFILFLMLKLFAPKSIIEVGTQYGKSTRRMIDMTRKLGMPIKIQCFDIANLVKHFQPDEANLVLKDLTDTFKHDVLDIHPPGLIYLDAHPYKLILNVIQEVLRTPDWRLAIHDCSAILCNPKMEITKDDPNITSRTGIWERYCLAAAFGIADPLDEKLNRQETPTHLMRVFSTLHGLCVIIPKKAS